MKAGPTPDAVDASPGWAPRPFRPPPWARNPHVQTLAGKFLRPRPPMPLRRERWDTPDGDFLDLDFAPAPPGEGPVALVLHGLEGNARRGYALLTYEALAGRGMRAVGMNFRGCGGGPNRRPRAYHSGATDDVAVVVEGLRVRFPDSPLVMVGFSLGGNVLLKYLGELGPEGPEVVAAAAAVSVPYDLDAGGRLLEETVMGRLYSRHFLRSLVTKAEAKRPLLEGLVDLERAAASRTIRAFDDAVTAPLHGFRDAAHYYRACSSVGFLDRIRVPTLLVHALDDPFLPRDAVPEHEARANPSLTPLFVPRGGHVGFVHGPPWAPRFWAEGEVSRFLDSNVRASRHPGPGT